MERYKNLGGASGVVAFKSTPAAIEVKFQDGAIYLYTSDSAGVAHLATMKRLAEAGYGLNSFISRVVRKGYASKLR